jgi:3-oxoacyl-[acyl-carrier-protein] synthase III
MARTLLANFIAPPQRLFTSVEAEEISRAYGFLWDDGAASMWPFGRLRGPGDDALRYRSPTEVPICAAPAGQSSADLALAVARSVFDALGETQRASIDAIIYCHSSIDEAWTGSPAGRLSFELGMPRVLSFAVSQVHNCAFFTGLQIAQALLDGPEALRAVLIVAADKWLYPYVRSFGPLACFGDGAGALYIHRDSDPGFELLHVELSASRERSSVFTAAASFEPGLFAKRVVDVIAAALKHAGITPAQVDLVIPQNYDVSLIRLIQDRAGLHPERVYLDGHRRHGHLSSADTIANFVGATAAGVHGGEILLLWGLGLNGEAACCLLRASGS